MRPSTSQIVYDSLRNKILSSKLRPGSALPTENELAAEYGMSRPTVRKALEQLENDRLIIKRAGIGNFVNDPNQEHINARKRLVFAIENAYSSEYYTDIIIRGMKEACDLHGCQLSLSGVKEFLSTGQSSSDGIAMLTSDPEDFERCSQLSQQTGQPIILINRFPPQPNLAYLSVDYAAESIRAVDHLLSLGHHDIAMIGYSKINPTTGLRSRGWELAFQQRGLAVPARLRFPEENMWQSVDLLVDFLKKERPTALFVGNGGIFSQVIHALGVANLQIGKNISLICFDDMECMSDRLGVPISYVKMPLMSMGRRAIEHLLSRHEDKDSKPLRAVFEASLVINSACKPPVNTEKRS